jgi:hypothetical protein
MGFLSPLIIEELVAVIKLIFYAGIGNLVTKMSISFKKVHISTLDGVSNVKTGINKTG